ncbi:pilus assembly protein TadG-related protein [Bosea sp. 2RAB26]|uniref:TadE/TadG family type IV pilus assembly protein n=1 Tax=Bosea sp. 2RAB26 TaxID=3237476 RepID=UPI003F8F0CCB
MSLRSNRLYAALKKLVHREDGGVLIMFGLTAPVLIGLTFALIDYNRASTTRLALQTGLDSAALYIARSDATSGAEIQRLGMAMLRANMDNAKYGKLTSANFRMDAQQRVIATAEATVPVSIMALLGKENIPVGAKAEVVRSSNSIEVGLALDVTGSMKGQDLIDLKSAAKDLIDLVVKDQQTPYYSKVALVPYSMAVNVGSYATQVRGSYKAGTSTTPGSDYYEFRRYSDNKLTSQRISTCVTERSGGYAYTDASPSVALLGRNYPGSGNSCLGSTILPLSSDRTILKGKIDSYVAEGSTAGHIGLAWAWYMVSPNFGGLWSGASKPADYGTRELLKVVVLMTDGAFNTPYYNGVIAKDAGTGSGSDAEKINANASNGSSVSQATKLCENMKTAGVIVYTVGLGVGSDATANKMLTDCATSTKHVYFPSSGTTLKDAFRAIGQEINSLRIAR